MPKRPEPLLNILLRTLHVLNSAGIKRVYLDLSSNEKVQYNRRIKPKIGRIKDMEVIEEFSDSSGPNKRYLLIPSNLFIHPGSFSRFNSYFKAKGASGNEIKPVIREDQFLLRERSDYQRAINLVKNSILGNTEGYIARNINKKISF